MKRKLNKWDKAQRKYMWQQFCDLTGPYKKWKHPPHGKRGKTKNVTFTKWKTSDAKKEVVIRMKMRFPKNAKKYTLGSISNQINYVISKQNKSYYEKIGNLGNFQRNLLAAHSVDFIDDIDLLKKHPNLIK